MPEIKNQFTGGKMNKDVDERLIPSGEYRDAMNIQVSTSEGSDVGAIQNILGNINIPWINPIDGITIPLRPGSVCVGSISDEKNDAFYYFIREPEVLASQGQIQSPSGLNFIDGITSRRNLILEHKNQTITPVFIDVAELTVQATMANPVLGNLPILTSTGFNSINVGDTLTAFGDVGGFGIWNGPATVLSVDPVNQTINIGDFTNSGLFGYQGQGAGSLYFSVNKGKSALKFPIDASGNAKIITGINIVDDMLFWTDGVTEPKKINISRSIQGTNPNGQDHTLLINPDQNISTLDGIRAEEKHITVIRKAPKNVLTVKTETIPDFLYGTTPVTQTFLIDPNNPAQGNLVPGLTFDIQLWGGPGFNPSSWVNPLNPGDILLFNPSSSSSLPSVEYQVSVLLENIVAGPTNPSFQWWTVTVVSIGQISPTPQEYNWSVQFDIDQNFKNKFPRFSYRYKYQDGEYSTFAPFTNVIFETGDFKYDVKEAYNLGMENKISSIKLSSYQINIPKDVVSVDLLYKESNSPAIYTIDTLKKSYILSSNAGYEVKPNQIRAMLPENQLLRAWDTVPRNSLAQEVSGSRIIYGNYLQNYEMPNDGKIEAKLTDRGNCDLSLLTSTFNGLKSLKSIRNYSLGISYLDKYGRQTPVFTNKQADIEIPIDKSDNTNQVEIQPLGSIPWWATHYKVFVKETSNEYYNLAMDRVYDARDGNIWLSFPSSDRNKVDEETFLILKKGVEGAQPVDEKNRYKILAIENEAPTFIKTELKILGTVREDGSGTFPGTFFSNNSGYPIINSKKIIISKNDWDVVGLALDDIEKLEVTFSILVGGTLTQESRFYEVVNFGIDATNTPALEYELLLKKGIDVEDIWLSNPSLLSEPEATIGITIYKKEVENLPQFDGRFFVKVARDIIIDEYIVSQAIESMIVTQTPTTQIPFYYLSDSNSWNGNDTSSAISGISGAATSSSSEWEAFYAQTGAAKSAWFIDQAYYGGYFPPSDHSTLNTYGLSKHGTGSTTVYSKAATSGYNKGIWTDASGQAWIYLSFGYIKTDDNNSWISSDSMMQSNNPSSTQIWVANCMAPWNSTGGCNYDAYENMSLTGGMYDHGNTNNRISMWKVGDGVLNPHHSAESAKVLSIVQGQKFKFLGDPNNTIYTINAPPELYYHLSYYDYQELEDAKDASYDIWFTGSSGSMQGPATENWIKEISKFSHSRNRRATWRIPIDANPTDAGSTFNPIAAGQADASNIGTIQFVESVWSNVDDQVVAEDPAIWETEPKQDVDLDIYYEVDGTFPLEINNETNYTFAPIGTTISVEFNTSVTVAVVESWDGNIVTLGDSQGGTILGQGINDGDLMETNSWSVDELLSNYPDITFNRPDGSCVRGTMLSWPGFYYPSGLGTVRWTDSIEIHPNIANNPVNLSWFNCYSFGNGVESDRIRDDYNQVKIDKGAKASSTLDEPYKEEHRKYGLIYSGLYNSTSGVNNLNQFIAAEKITKDINPIYGSIQKLHSRSTADGDLITLCEDRILKILANKDAVYNADGNTNLTATENVLGQAIPYAGEYGISKNPESFASEAYRVYFTDKVRGAVMRLSKDGLTPISEHGMKDWFRDNLQLNNELIGSYDDRKDEYNLTLSDSYKTISFREDVRGWVSFKSFVPEHAVSCANEYYTMKDGGLWQHHADIPLNYNTFYNVHKDSSFKVILNEVPGSIKSFTTLNYEGSQSKINQVFDPNTGAVLQDGEYYNLNPKDGWYVYNVHTEQDTGSLNEFINKEDKWFNYIRGKTLNINQSTNSWTAENYDGNNFAHQGLGKILSAPINVTVYGCMDSTMSNYNPAADFPDPNDPCIPFIYGCMDSTASNYDPLANTSDGSCLYIGCTDNNTVNGCGIGCNGAINYDPQANVSCASCCVYCILGCTDPTMFNYSASATCDDGSCIAYIYGCTDDFNSNVANFDPLANTDDGSCDYLGCTNPVTTDALGNPYNAAQNFLWDYSLYGGNYVNANGNSMACLDVAGNNAVYSQIITSPTHSSALNTINSNPNVSPLLTLIPPCASVDDGSCIITGCTDNDPATNAGVAINFDPIATVPQTNSCVYCPDVLAINYDDIQNQYTNSSTAACVYCPEVQNITTSNVTSTSFDITWESPSPIIPPQGQTNPGDNGVYSVKIHWGVSSQVPPYGTGTSQNPGGGYFQYVPYYLANGTVSYPAITDNGNGTLTITVSLGQFGQGVVIGAPGIIPNTTYSIAIDTFCTNDTGGFDANGNALANIDTEFIASNSFGQVQVTTVAPPVLGCTDPFASNYDPNATQDDGSCIAFVYGCTDPLAANYNAAPNVVEDGSCQYPGCMDSSQCNYDPNANVDDGSCQPFIVGCFDVTAMNYAGYTTPGPCDISDSTTCVYQGCMDTDACNYNPAATFDCIGGVPPQGSFGDTSCCNYCGDDTALNFSGVLDPNCTVACEYCNIIEPQDSDGIYLKTAFGPNDDPFPTNTNQSYNSSTNTVQVNFHLQIPSAYDLSNVAETPWFVGGGSTMATIYEIWYVLEDLTTGATFQYYSDVLTTTAAGQVTHMTVPMVAPNPGWSTMSANNKYSVTIGVACFDNNNNPVAVYSTLSYIIDTTVL